MAEEHDRKTRVNVNVPAWGVAWLAAVLEKYPGVWRSKGDLALHVLKLGMRAFHAGAPAPRGAPPAAEGKGLNVSLTPEVVSWFESVLVERADVARSRRDLVFVVLRVGMRAFEAADPATRLDVQSQQDAEVLVPPELVRAARDLLRAHPAIAEVVGKETPAEWTARAIRDAMMMDLGMAEDRDATEGELATLLPPPIAIDEATGGVKVAASTTRGIRTFIEDHRAFARSQGYATPEEYVRQAVETALTGDEAWATEQLEPKWTCSNCGEAMREWDKSGHFLKRRDCWDAQERRLLGKG